VTNEIGLCLPGFDIDQEHVHSPKQKCAFDPKQESKNPDIASMNGWSEPSGTCGLRVSPRVCSNESQINNHSPTVPHCQPSTPSKHQGPKVLLTDEFEAASQHQTPQL